jgi:hypothetical protein
MKFGAKQNPSPKTELVVVLGRKDKQIPSVWSIQPRDIPAPAPFSVHLKKADNWLDLGYWEIQTDSASSLLNGFGIILGPILWFAIKVLCFRELFSGIVCELQKKITHF